MLYKWNGSSWIKPIVNKWNGSSWVKANAFKWNGSSWANITAQQYTTVWEANWTQTYREAGTKRTDYRGEKICQGRYVYEPWGIMRSLIGFPNMQSTLAGSKIIKTEIYLRNEHWYYYSGGYALIGYHGHSSRPDTFSHSFHNFHTEKFNARGEGRWITISNSIGEGIRNGNIKGLSLFANSGEYKYYGVFYGANDGASKPKIRITYEK